MLDKWIHLFNDVDLGDRVSVVTPSPEPSVPPGVLDAIAGTQAPEGAVVQGAENTVKGAGEQFVPLLQNPKLTVALIVVAAVLLVAVIALLLINRYLRGRRKATEEDPTPGNITQVSIGKIHAQGAREYQQDSFTLSDPSLLQSQGLLAVVADGMGGLENGDEVSVALVKTLLSAFSRTPRQPTGERQLLLLTQQAVAEVNQMLGPERYRKCGSTMAMGLVRDSRFSFLSVGDSHIYLMRHGSLILLNREHDFKNELALRAVNGEMTVEEALNDKRGGSLTNFIGMGELEHLDLPAEPLTLCDGDKLILMSDGIYNALTAEELRAALAGTPEEAAARVGALIAAKGYTDQDNYTGIIIQCRSGTGQRRDRE